MLRHLFGAHPHCSRHLVRCCMRLHVAVVGIALPVVLSSWQRRAHVTYVFGGVSGTWLCQRSLTASSSPYRATQSCSPGLSRRQWRSQGQKLHIRSGGSGLVQNLHGQRRKLCSERLAVGICELGRPCRIKLSKDCSCSKSTQLLPEFWMGLFTLSSEVHQAVVASQFCHGKRCCELFARQPRWARMCWQQWHSAARCRPPAFGGQGSELQRRFGQCARLAVRILCSQQLLLKPRLQRLQSLFKRGSLTIRRFAGGRCTGRHWPQKPVLLGQLVLFKGVGSLLN